MSGRATNGLVKPPQTHLTPWWLSWMLCLSTVHEQTVKYIRLKVFSSPPPADMGLGMPDGTGDSVVLLHGLASEAGGAKPVPMHSLLGGPAQLLLQHTEWSVSLSHCVLLLLR